MIRIHIIHSYRPGGDGERTVRIRIRWYGEEVTVGADEVRRTALAVLRAVWWLDTHSRLTGQGLSDEQATLALGPLPAPAAGTEGGFQVSIGPGGTVRLARPGIRTRALIPRGEAETMGTGWFRIAESADADARLLQALKHTTGLPQTQVADLFAYLWVLRSDDPVTELGG